GWRFQLARFADVVTQDAFAAAGDAVATWFASWNDADADHRRAALAQITTADVRFRDAHGDIYGLDELANHAGAVQRFMPGLTLELRGTVRRAHDLALADWAAVARDGKLTLAGTNVFRFAPDGRIAEVTGISSSQ
ncbi:MAG: nuclear transport factor 2 family protein, partial [Solirubrobacteraceae bacterium]